MLEGRIYETNVENEKQSAVMFQISQINCFCHENFFSQILQVHKKIPV